MLNYNGGAAWGRRPIGQCVFPGSGLCISFALQHIAHSPESIRVLQLRDAITVDLFLTTDQLDFVLRCRIEAPTNHRRQDHRYANHRNSAWIIAAMVLLLALCGWVAGGVDGARRAIARGAPRPAGTAISREAMLRWFGARMLNPADLPDLFGVLAEVCHRARLARLPDLYYVAAPAMNAFACGASGDSAIIVTDGLLRGMSPGEIAGILAHEVAHIRNQDAWAMDWASALRRAIESASCLAIARLQAQRGGTSSCQSLLNLLSAAPTIARLLFLALSRTRELEADATALELTGNMQALLAALAKLECHHSGAANAAIAAFADDPMRLLRTHPATSERVVTLLGLTC